MATQSRTRLWVDHAQDGVLFKLKHLHPHFVEFQVAARPAEPGRPGRPARKFNVRVEYSHHCFSRGLDKVDNYDPDHLYTWLERPDEPRVFCRERHADSFALPQLISTLDQRNVYPTRHHNHFAVTRTKPEGHYSIWFRVENRRHFLLMVIESAYVRLDMDEQIANSTATRLADVLVQAIR